jgi:hypothetical protein
MTDQATRARPPMIELDLSGERPVVLVDGEMVTGVSSAVLEVNAFETPVLIIRLVRFEVTGGELPYGMTLRREA